MTRGKGVVVAACCLVLTALALAVVHAGVVGALRAKKPALRPGIITVVDVGAAKAGAPPAEAPLPLPPVTGRKLEIPSPRAALQMVAGAPGGAAALAAVASSQGTTTEGLISLAPPAMGRLTLDWGEGVVLTPHRLRTISDPQRGEAVLDVFAPLVSGRLPPAYWPGQDVAVLAGQATPRRHAIPGNEEAEVCLELRVQFSIRDRSYDTAEAYLIEIGATPMYEGGHGELHLWVGDIYVPLARLGGDAGYAAVANLYGGPTSRSLHVRSRNIAGHTDYLAFYYLRIRRLVP